MRATVTRVDATRVDATRVDATRVDATRGTLTLKPRHGDAKTFKANRDAVDLRQVRVGDEVHAVLVEELAVVLISGGAPTSVGAAAAVALAPEGEKPGVVMADTVEATATVVAIDAHDHAVTLEFLDGRIEEVKVSKKRDLSKVALGDSVRVQLTEAIAIAVVRP
jgi:hypothetical protein